MAPKPKTKTNLQPFATGLTAISSAFAQRQQSKARKYISEANKFVGDIQAKQAKKIGRQRESRSRGSFKKLLGKQRASLAAQGLDISSGSAADIQQETQEISELDALTIQINAARAAFGFESAGRGFEFQSQQEDLTSQNEIFQTLLSGGLQAYDQYQRR